MTGSLKILSWNIQKFGADKVNDADVVNFICRVIKIGGADVVGLMELVGWQGNETRDALVTALNNLETYNKTGVTWDGVASEMTPARPNEQYLYLWKKNLFAAQGWQLWNVISEDLFDSFFTHFSLDAAWQEQFWQSIYNNGWMNAAFQVSDRKRSLLVADYKNFDLSANAPTLTLSDQQKQMMVGLLLAEEVITFPVKGSRPPFLLAGKAGSTKTDVLLVLFHAPGPGNGLPIIASNMLSFLDPVRNSGVAVVMGDFNVDADKCKTQYSLEYFDLANGRLAYVHDSSGNFISAYPFQRLTGPDFANTAVNSNLSSVLKYGQRLSSAKTSISTTLAGANVGASDASVESILSSEYDRFFVRAPKPDPTAALAWNLMDAMVPKQVAVPGLFGQPTMEQRSNTQTTYYKPLAEAAALAYNTWWDRQNAKKRKSSDTAKKLQEGPKLGATALPGSLREAQYVYRNALSDHLPIIMELQYV